MSRQSIPLLTLTLTAADAITAGRFVTAAGTQAGADANAVGVSNTSAVAGEKFPTDVLGTAAVESGAAIATGNTLKVDAQGRAIPWAGAGARVAIALEAASGGGEFIEVLLIPNAA